MKTVDEKTKTNKGLFAPDGYEWDDAPKDVAEAMDAAAGPLPMDFLPPPEDILFGVGKKTTTIRIDEDVLEWFKSFGKGYQTKINAVLRAYKRAFRTTR